MNLNQINSNVLLRNRTYLRVSSEKAIELIKYEDERFTFRIRFGIYVSSFSEELKTYDKVQITLKKKENVGATPLENQLRFESENRFKPITDRRYNKALQNKLYSGINLVRSFNKKEDILNKTFVYIQGSINEAQKYQYNIADLAIVNSAIQNPQSSANIADNSKLNPKSLLERVNKEKYDPSAIARNTELRSLTSNNLNEIPKTVPLIYDLSRFCLIDVPSSEKEKSKELKKYKNYRRITSIDIVDFYADVVINEDIFNDSVIVRYDLLSSNDNSVVESASLEFSPSQHLSAYKNLKIEPVVSAKIDNNQCTLSISNIEAKTKKRSSGVNIYIKNIDKFGSVESYRKIRTIKSKDSVIECTIPITENLSVIRVVPLDLAGEESGIFTNIVVGEGHNSIGTLTLTTIPVLKGIQVEIHNIPKNCSHIDLYRRNCTESPNSAFEIIDSFNPENGLSVVSRVDSKNLNLENVYEYFSIAHGSDVNIASTFSIVSNYSMIKNKSQENATISVSLETVAETFDSIGRPILSFEIKTAISKQENENITESLKNQLGELYKQFLDPVSNPSSPLGSDKGIPNYADIFIHEVSRINLNTGEKENFSFVVDGIFSDDAGSQSISNVKPINPQHSYIYQIFTYRKNPIELFKKFVARGTSSKGKEWFYLPYKWRSSQVKFGKLYADDDEGIPIIEEYDSFTSNSYGLTASYKLDGSTNFSSITNVEATRLDINTIKIEWYLSEKTKKTLNLPNSTISIDEIHDCFIVMKVVNEERKFVGATKNSYFYDDLSEEDAGTVYYIVLPVMNEFDIDEPGYSNDLFVNPSDLSDKIRSSYSRMNPYQFGKLESQSTQSIDLNSIDNVIKSKVQR